MKKKKIRVLKIEPMDHPSVCYIEPTIKAIKRAVGADLVKYGDIEAKMIAYRVYAVFNKDRFLTSLEPNRQIDDDIIVGTMFIVAVDENRLPISLTDEQIEIYSSMFYGIEVFDDMDVVEANINTMISKLIQYDVL
jgi:hypothetical protein